MHSQVVSSCLVGLSFVYLCRLWPSALVGLRSWRRLKVLLGLGVQQRAYLNKLILAPSSHCGRWTLILCNGTLFILFMSPFLDLFMLLVVLSHAYINTEVTSKNWIGCHKTYLILMTSLYAPFPSVVRTTYIIVLSIVLFQLKETCRSRIVSKV